MPYVHYSSLFEAFWSHVAHTNTNECWAWTGNISHGYGRIQYDGKMYRAHQLSYILHHGEYMAGMCVCHRCDNPPCVNPGHLFLGTVKDNVQDALKKGRLKVPKARARGENHGHARLTTTDVLYIREMALTVELRDLAQHLGVSKGAIQHIVYGDTWVHVHGGTPLFPGRGAHGEAHCKAKLTSDKVIAIRTAHAEGASIHALSRQYGVSCPSIKRIIRRTGWKHIA